VPPGARRAAEKLRVLFMRGTAAEQMLQWRRRTDPAHDDDADDATDADDDPRLPPRAPFWDDAALVLLLASCQLERESRGPRDRCLAVRPDRCCPPRHRHAC